MTPNNKYYIFLLTAIIFFSCTKYKLDEPALEVTADKTSIKAGESVTFYFKGDPQILSFYSGSFLNDYNSSISGRELTNAFLSFSSTVATGTQQNQLSVLVSSDFNGKYNIADIKAANWVDITNRFVLASGSTATASTAQDIFDLVQKNKPLYVAFRYITQPQAENGIQRNWSVSSVLLASKPTGGDVTLLDYASGSNFGMFSFGNKESGRSMVSSAALLFKGNAPADLQGEYTEDWAVSRMVNVNPNDLGPDRAIPLKLFTQAKKESYTYTYFKAGTYTATFIGATNNVYGAKEVVKQIAITVAE